MEVVFGKMQDQMSDRMRRYPLLARLVRAVFGYTLVGNYARALTFQELMDQLPTDLFQKVMDLGCGFGEYSFMMASALPEATVTALDINLESVSTIRKVARNNNISNLETHIGKIQSLKNQEESYDLIFSVDVFEHIQEEEMPFRGAWDKLKKGGHLLVKMPNREQLTILPEDWFEDHHDWLEDEHIGQIYDLEGLKNRMESEGFEVVYATYADGWWSRLGWELGYLSHKAGPIVQLLCLPFAKLMVRVDRWVHNRKDGNTIQVIGKKR